MSEILETNGRLSEALKSAVGFSREPVAVRLIREGEEFPGGYERPSKQMSHCQAVFAASRGSCIAMTLEDESCHVGASALGMCPTPEKVASGAFHAGIGIHDSPEGAAAMIAERSVVPGKVAGEVVCPLSYADFEPDVVVFVDVPEKCYWVAVALETAGKGGRVQFSTSPFQCACEDLVAVPIVTGGTNISLGCFGCRKKTDMESKEMAVGVPYSHVRRYAERLPRYADGPLRNAKRD